MKLVSLDDNLARKTQADLRDCCQPRDPKAPPNTRVPNPNESLLVRSYSPIKESKPIDKDQEQASCKKRQSDLKDLSLMEIIKGLNYDILGQMRSKPSLNYSFTKLGAETTGFELKDARGALLQECI